MMDYFSQLRKSKQKAFVPYLVAGYPEKRTTSKLLLAAEEAGVHAIELGVPFSDPVSDGPVLQKASFQALENGITLEEVLATVEEVKPKIRIPILLMGYVNPFLQFGWKRLVRRAAQSGVSGFVIPDLPLEESQAIASLFQSNGLYHIPLCAPTTQTARIRAIGKLAHGFVYLVSVKGVTGERSQLPEDLENCMKHVKREIQKPVYVGFGVSTKEQAKTVARLADGVIVGSRIASFLEAHQEESDLDVRLTEYLRSWAKEVERAKQIGE